MGLQQTVPNKPWLCEDGTIVMFDPVHLIKNLRNLWYTDKMGELKFNDNGKDRIAKWELLRKTRETEKNNLVRLSDLTDVATEPKPIERQRVETALKVFSENTAAAIATNPQLTDTEDTVIFIRKVLKFWKIFNVRTEGLDRRFNNPAVESFSSDIENPPEC